MRTNNQQRFAERFRKTFFLIGLVGALWFTHVALSYKSYYNNSAIPETGEVIDLDLTDIVITIREDKTPPQKVEKKKIEIVQEIIKIMEPVVDPIPDPIIPIDPINQSAGIEIIESVPEPGQAFRAMIVLDRKPIFKGCENISSEEERFECFKEKITKHVRKNFEVKDTWGTPENVMIHFVIDSNGKVKDIVCTRGDDSNSDEAVRVIGKLPDFVPGRYNGKDVSTRYSLPIAIKK